MPAALEHARAGAQRYRAVLATPGARAPVIFSALGSMPIGMFTLGILLLARDTTGSFAEAGRVVGAFGLANALGAVAQGRLMDRLGQTRVLLAAAVGHTAAVGALVAAAAADAPAWTLMACAVAGGACLPQLPAAMRSLWSMLVHDEDGRQAAYALVPIVFEVAVVTGPLITAGIVAVSSPSVAVLAAGAVCSGSAVAFGATAASRRWRGARHDVGWLGPLAGPGIRTVVVVMAAFGTGIGVVQVLLPAYAAERGSAEAGGLLLALLPAGSFIGGIVYGARSWTGAPVRRLALLMLALGTGFALIAVAEPPAVLAVLLVASGIFLAPAAVLASTLLDTVAPVGTVTEAFTLMVMAIVAGTAVGNALGGALLEEVSYDAAALASGAIAVLGAAVAVARRQTLAPAG